MKIKATKDLVSIRETVLFDIDTKYLNHLTENTPIGIFSDIYRDKVKEAEKAVIDSSTLKDNYYVKSLTDALSILEKDHEVKTKKGILENKRLEVKCKIRHAKHETDIIALRDDFFKLLI